MEKCEQDLCERVIVPFEQRVMLDFTPEFLPAEGEGAELAAAQLVRGVVEHKNSAPAANEAHISPVSAGR